MGQGIETALAQVAAQTLGIDLEDVTIVSGDTTNCPYTGYGTGASRGAAMGGATLMKAAEVLRGEKQSGSAPTNSRRPPRTSRSRGGRVFVRGSKHQAVTLAEIGDAAYRRLNGKFPEDEDPTPSRSATHSTPRTSPGPTAAPLRWSRSTVKPASYDRAAATSSPTTAGPPYQPDHRRRASCTAARLRGSLRHCSKSSVYNEEGQLTTGTFMDYAIPTFMEIPRFDLRHMDPRPRHTSRAA